MVAIRFVAQERRPVPPGEGVQPPDFDQHVKRRQAQSTATSVQDTAGVKVPQYAF